MPAPHFKGLGKKIFNTSRRILGKRSREISISTEVADASSRSASDTTHFNRSDSLAKGDIQPTTANNNDVQIARPDSRQNMDRHYPADEQNMDNIETVQEIQLNEPAISDNRSLEQTLGNDENSAVSVMPESAQLPTAMFNGLQNTLIAGGTFVQHIHTNRRGFEFLKERVATAGFHNSAKRFDPPRCHPDTRVAILDEIYDWIIQSNNRRQWLLWLNGAAGAGKSAIMQSIAERCVAEKAIQLAVASFFFFRTDPTRNTMSSLVATLAYQLLQAVPELSDSVLLTIERHPLIFDESLESQLQQLIIQPLLRLSKHLHLLFVVLIDGLDECDNRAHQSNLINVLADIISRSSKITIVFLVASRREPQIEAAFVEKRISKLVRTLRLDKSDIEQTSSDIRHFLTTKFNYIKENHLHRNVLPTDWPPISAIEEIIAKSSGQFIYASVVINYVSSPRAKPSRQLEIVRDLLRRDPLSQNPFAHLDALYQHIFSQVEALPLDQLLDILAFILITSEYNIYNIELVFLLEAGDLVIFLADLAAIIECEQLDPTNASDQLKIKFLHASLPDFLLDKSRSERYHIDADEYRTKLLCMFLERDPLQWRIHDMNIVSTQMTYYLSAISALLLGGAKPSDRLQHSFMNFKFASPRIVDHIDKIASSAIVIVSQLKELSLGDQGKAYQHVLRVLASEIAENWPLLGKEIKTRAKDIPDLLVQIIHELISSAILNLSLVKESSSDDQSQAYRHSLDVLVAEIAENWLLVDKTIKNRMKETPDLLAHVINKIADSVMKIISQLKESSLDGQSQTYHLLDDVAIEIAENWHLVDKNIKSRVKETPDLLVRVINEIASSAIAILAQLKQSSSGDQTQAYRHVFDVLAVEIAENWHLVAKNIKRRMKTTPDLFARIINDIASSGIATLLQLKELGSDGQSQKNRVLLDMLAADIAENWRLLNEDTKIRMRETPDLLKRVVADVERAEAQEAAREDL